MKERYLETGEIVNTHGVRGEVKILPWSDSPDFLCQFKTLYIDGKGVRVNSAKVHKNMVLAALEGVDSVESAMKLKGKVVSIDREDAYLPAGRHFLADLIGLRVLDAATGEELGKLTEVLTPPAHPVYRVTGGEREYLIPAVPAFIAETDIDGGILRVTLIEGM